MNWETRLKEQVDRKHQNYVLIHIALDNALVDFPYQVAGDCVIVIDASSIGAHSTIKFNRVGNAGLELSKGRKHKTIFTEFFVSCSAQAGEWLDLLVGIDFDIEQLLKNNEITQTAFVITNAAPNTDTQAAAHACTGALIKAFSTNSGKVWVNFGAAAVASACYELSASEVLPVPLDNTNKIHCLFTVANEKATVIYKI